MPVSLTNKLLFVFYCFDFMLVCSSGGSCSTFRDKGWRLPQDRLHQPFLHMSLVSELEHLSPFMLQFGLSALWVDPRVLH